MSIRCGATAWGACVLAWGLMLGCGSRTDPGLAEGAENTSPEGDAALPTGMDAGVDAGPECGQITEIAAVPKSQIGIAVDATSVYWIGGSPQGYTGAVMRAPIGGGTSVTLVTNLYNPYAIAVDATSVYYTDTASLMSIPLSGGAPSTLIAGSDAFDLAAVNATSACIVSYVGDVLCVRKGGGTVTTVASGQLTAGATNIIGFAADATSLYWTRLDYAAPQALSTTVVKVALGGGAPITLASAPGEPTGLAVDATSVYWTVGTTVMKVPSGGGAATTLAAGSAMPPSGSPIVGAAGIAINSSSVTWIGSQGLMNVPLGGGVAVTLGCGQSTPGVQSVAVDATSVYWQATTGTGLGVFKMPLE